jgi:hypothetical protein
MGYAFFLNLESGYKRHGSEDERKQRVLVLDAGQYIQEGLEDRRCQIVSLTACICMYLRFKFMYVICMYVCMDYTLKLSVMAESGRSFELR